MGGGSSRCSPWRACLLYWLARPLGWIGFAATAWCVYFFRDPWRVTPDRAGLVVAPADGRIVAVDRAPPPPELEMGDTPMLRIGIFLNILDVHVNRMPMTGRITKRVYRKGKFFNASLDKASAENERMAVRVATAAGADIAVVQIAGLVARRIVCTVDAGEDVIAGQRFGLIRFGSRTDLYLPPAWAALGDRRPARCGRRNRARRRPRGRGRAARRRALRCCAAAAAACAKSRSPAGRSTA